MFTCPRCDVRLVRTRLGDGFCYVCPKCGGRAVALAVLRRMTRPEPIKEIWVRAHTHARNPDVRCPICRRPTVEVPVPIEKRNVRLDVCTGCQFVWFDPSELEQLPKPAAAPPRDKPLSQAVREAIAMREVASVAEKSRYDKAAAEEPEQSWHWIPGVLGMPVEVDARAVQHRPWVTWATAAAMVVTFLLTLGHLQVAVSEFGLVPAEPLRHAGLTLVASFFLHAGVFHLVGNTYFLLVFGDNVEDVLGRWRYVALLVAATLVGEALHILGDWQSPVPCIGASGGISGVIVFYALRFPRARLGFLYGYWYVYRWFYVPAYAALAVWIVFQLIGAHFQLTGVSNVSALAHLGGAAVGMLAWLLWRNR